MTTNALPSRIHAARATWGAVLLGLAACAFPTHGASAPVADTARAATRRAPLTALDRYVHQADPAYSWKLAGSVKGEGGTAYYLDMVSQNWLSTQEVNRTEWRHWVVVWCCDPSIRRFHRPPPWPSG